MCPPFWLLFTHLASAASCSSEFHSLITHYVRNNLSIPRNSVKIFPRTLPFAFQAGTDLYHPPSWLSFYLWQLSPQWMVWLPTVLVALILLYRTACPGRSKLSLRSGGCMGYSLKGRIPRLWDSTSSCHPGGGNPWLELKWKTPVKKRYFRGFFLFHFSFQGKGQITVMEEGCKMETQMGDLTGTVGFSSPCFFTQWY